MARAAFFCFPGDGHVNPTLSLVAELVRRGEQIDYYCTEPFRSVIERTGARFRSVGRTLEKIETSTPTAGLFLLGEVVAAATLEALPALDQALEREPVDYVLYDKMTPWGRLLAQKRKLPAIATFPTFASEPERVPLPPLPVLMMIFGPKNIPLNLRRLRHRRELTREVARRFAVDELTFRNLISMPAACNIVFTSERFQPRRAELDERYHFVGATLSEAPDPDFPRAQLEGKRVIYVTLGTVFNQNALLFRTCLETFDRPDECVVIGAGKRLDVAALGPLPKNCIVRPHVPQLEVLRRASLFISHGGMNSVTGGLFHQVPMLIRPQGADNFLNANRVQELGVGKKLGRGDLTPRRLRAKAESLMADEGARRNLKELSESLRSAGGAARAADVVFAFRDRVLPGLRAASAAAAI